MARGRFISRSLSTSEKIASLQTHAADLADFCSFLFVMLVSHADSEGRLQGDIFTVKNAIVPSSPRPLADVEVALEYLREEGLIQWYQLNSKRFIQIVRFAEHQVGLEKRGAKSAYPPPPSPELRGTPGNSGELRGTPGKHGNDENINDSASPRNSGELPGTPRNSETSKEKINRIESDQDQIVQQATSTVPRTRARETVPQRYTETRVSLEDLPDAPSRAERPEPHASTPDQKLKICARKGHPCPPACLRGVCVTQTLHDELIGKLGGDPGVASTTLKAFYVTVIASIPTHEIIPDDAFPFWRRQFAAHFSAKLPVAAPKEPGVDRNDPYLPPDSREEVMRKRQERADREAFAASPEGLAARDRVRAEMDKVRARLNLPPTKASES